jgi:hypothetical protein
MIDLIPTPIDGAIVFTILNTCHGDRGGRCENCPTAAITLHNWVKISGLEYIIFDLQDENDICPSFLEEIQQLQKRIGIPCLFSGVMARPQSLLDRFSYYRSYPTFTTPEDAVRALRIQHPGVTESEAKLPVVFGSSLIETFRHQWGDMGGYN